MLQLLMETDVEGLIGAGRYERAGRRTHDLAQRSPRPGALDTRLGSLQLRIPKLRQGMLLPAVPGGAEGLREGVDRGAIQEAWIGGGARSATGRRAGAGDGAVEEISKSQVSKLCKDIDELEFTRSLTVRWWANGQYLWLDATYLEAARGRPDRSRSQR